MAAAAHARPCPRLRRCGRRPPTRCAASTGGVQGGGAHRAGRRGALLLGAGAAVLSSAPPPSLAIYDTGDVIADPDEALRAVYAVSRALPALCAEISSLEGRCPAPTFPCDLSVVSKKANSRLSGPLKQGLNTLVEEFGVDPSLSEDALQNVSLAQTILYQNNARVQVDFKAPVQFLELAGGNLRELLEQVPSQNMEAAVGAYGACDMAVAPEAPGALECRLRRAVERDEGRDTPQGT